MDYIVKQGDNTFIIEQKKIQIKKDIISQYVSIRKEKHMSQEDVASITGIARANIARIESGRYVPTIEVLTKLAMALDMELEIKFVEKKGGVNE